MLTFDRADIQKSKREYTKEGYLKVPARIARTGIQQYRHDFIPQLNKAPGDVISVYRSPDAVFDKDSLATYALKPVSNDHPTTLLNSKTVKAYNVGTLDSDSRQDGDYILTTLVVMDEQAIKDIESGKCEISVGYECDYDLRGGYTPDGQRFDAEQKNIICNHVAIVARGRAGKACRVFDSADENLKEGNMKKITFDGMTIEVTEQGAQAIDKLEARLDTAKTDNVKAKASFDAKEAEIQAKLDAKEQEVKEAKALVTTDADLDALVAKRSQIIADAKTLKADVVTAGKSNAEIIESVVIATCDGIDLDGKDDAFKSVYCQARFDAALSVAKKGDGSERMKVTADGKDMEDENESADEKARKKFISGGE